MNIIEERRGDGGEMSGEEVYQTAIVDSREMNGEAIVRPNLHGIRGIACGQDDGVVFRVGVQATRGNALTFSIFK